MVTIQPGRDTDQGSWLIVHLEELICTFFLPLPEPLGFPPDQVLQTFLRMTTNTIELLKTSPVPILLQPMAHGGLSD